MESELYDQDSEFWRKYSVGRPVIPASFYQRFYEYHAAHSGSFHLVHDVGAGFGDMSIELARKFKQVIVSDPAPKSLEVAKKRISNIVGEGGNSFSFRCEKVEDSDLPVASVDAIFSCNALHWMNLDAAMRVMTAQLRPGGTLFIAFFGIPRFEPSIQPIWERIMDAGFREVVKRVPRGVIEQAAAIQNSGYDALALPEPEWRPGAIRLKLNTAGVANSFVQAPEFSKSIPHLSGIGAHDLLQTAEEDNWFFKADVGRLRDIAESYPFDASPEVLDPFFSEIDSLLVGDTCQGHWPVSIVMATRQEEELKREAPS